jgi:hypothetical protein
MLLEDHRTLLLLSDKGLVVVLLDIGMDNILQHWD